MKKATKFVVETVSSFYEVHIVEAKNEEEARKIAENSDYNASKWLGQHISNITKYDERDLPRLKQIDSYFFEGVAKIDKSGHIVYVHPNNVEYKSPFTVNINELP